MRNPSRLKVLSLSLALSWGLFVALPVAAQNETVMNEPVTQEMAFAAWLADVKADALINGIDAALVDEALGGLMLDPKVIELDNKQAEFTQTFNQYASKRLSDTRIAKGREMMKTYRADLTQVAAKYGVQPRFIVAIWGLETNYGGFTGGNSVIRSLATLAFSSTRGSRAGYFRKELLVALQILQDGHIAPDDMQGSWAGAMGQGQFMPSSFVEYAQDFDGDGRNDIWLNVPDVLASIAYYLQRHNWSANITWGRQVLLPPNFSEIEDDIAQANPTNGCRAQNAHSKKLLLSEWNYLGFRRLNGDALPRVDITAALVRPDEDSGLAYLVYDNYTGILRYNCSNFYALVVGQLADRVAE